MINEGFIYLILSVDDNGEEYYKIGVTKREPIKRLKQLQTGNSNKLSLINSYKSKNYIKIEKWMHNKYHSYKTQSHNEWFYLNSENVLNFINDCKEADENINYLIINNPFYR